MVDVPIQAEAEAAAMALHNESNESDAASLAQGTVQPVHACSDQIPEFGALSGGSLVAPLDAMAPITEAVIEGAGGVSQGDVRSVLEGSALSVEVNPVVHDNGAASMVGLAMREGETSTDHQDSSTQMEEGDAMSSDDMNTVTDMPAPAALHLTSRVEERVPEGSSVQDTESTVTNTIADDTTYVDRHDIKDSSAAFGHADAAASERGSEDVARESYDMIENETPLDSALTSTNFIVRKDNSPDDPLVGDCADDKGLVYSVPAEAPVAAIDEMVED